MDSVSEEFAVKIEKVFTHEVKTSIIYALQLYGPLNLSKIAQILGKSEGSIHHQIKALEDEFIEIDVEATKKGWGIFYRLNQSTMLYFDDQIQKKIDYYMTAREESSMDISDDPASFCYNVPEGIDSYIDTISRLTTLHSNLQRFSARQLLAKVDMNKQLPIGTFNGFMGNFQINTWDQAVRFLKLIREFQEKINELMLESDNSEHTNGEDMLSQYFYFYTAPIKIEGGN